MPDDDNTPPEDHDGIRDGLWGMPSMVEQHVMDWWTSNYNPVTDVAGTFGFVDEAGNLQTGTVMDDGTVWTDEDGDGWFDGLWADDGTGNWVQYVPEWLI